MLATLDGDDATVDGTGKGGWTAAKLHPQLQQAFAELTDLERASYYILSLEEANLAFGENLIEPTTRRFEVHGKWITSGNQVVAIEIWGNAEVEDRLRVYLKLRFPHSDAPTPVRRWRTHLKPDGSFQVRHSMRGQKLHYGHYFLSALCDPSLIFDPSSYVLGEFKDHRGRLRTEYWMGYQRRVLDHGSEEQIQAEEVVLKRFYTRMLDELLLPLHQELHQRWEAIDSGQQDVTEEVVSGEGPVPEVVQIFFDDSRWRQFMDHDLRPVLGACNSRLRQHRKEYLAPRFPEILGGMQLCIRNLDALSRRLSQALYRRYGLPVPPQDTDPLGIGHRSWQPWQRQLDASVVSLRKLGARGRTVDVLQRKVEARGWRVPEDELDLPDREEVLRGHQAELRRRQAVETRGDGRVAPPREPRETD